MPQFDKITFFNQIFWLILLFCFFYFLLLKKFLPIIATVLKLRAKKLIKGGIFKESSYLKTVNIGNKPNKHIIRFLSISRYSMLKNLEAYNSWIKETQKVSATTKKIQNLYLTHFNLVLPKKFVPFLISKKPAVANFEQKRKTIFWFNLEIVTCVLERFCVKRPKLPKDGFSSQNEFFLFLFYNLNFKLNSYQIKKRADFDVFRIAYEIIVGLYAKEMRDKDLLKKKYERINKNFQDYSYSTLNMNLSGSPKYKKQLIVLAKQFFFNPKAKY